MSAITLPEDTTSCCRTCLNGASINMYDIFDERQDHFSVAKMITACTAVKIETADNRFPKKICRSCYHSLMSFYDFKKLAEDIDLRLHEYLNNCLPQLPIKYETKEEEIELTVNDLEDLNVKNEILNFSEDSMPLAHYTDEEITVPQNKKVRKKSRLKWTLDHDRKSYVCEVCLQRFKYHTSFIKHTQKHNESDIIITDNSKFIPCDICSKSFKSQNSLAAHKRKHVLKGRILACKVCDKIFKKVSHLKRHEMSHEDRPYKCLECSRSFLTEVALLEHIDYKHRGIRPYPCPICAKGFAHQAVLSNHIKIHMRERPYLCPTCGKRFDSSTNLKQHISRHNGERMFECDQCPMKFITKGELKSHEHTHTGIKAYACEQCGASYTKNSSLKKHMLTRHLGDRPFKCDSCSIRFTLKEHLQVHTRIHTGEKPYRCEHCDRAFTQSGDLLKHKRAHFGNQLYKCNECGEGFRLKIELRQHISKHYVTSKAMENNTRTDKMLTSETVDIGTNSDKTFSKII